MSDTPKVMDPEVLRLCKEHAAAQALDLLKEHAEEAMDTIVELTNLGTWAREYGIPALQGISHGIINPNDRAKSALDELPKEDL